MAVFSFLAMGRQRKHAMGCYMLWLACVFLHAMPWHMPYAICQLICQYSYSYSYINAMCSVIAPLGTQQHGWHGARHWEHDACPVSCRSVGLSVGLSYHLSPPATIHFERLPRPPSRPAVSSRPVSSILYPLSFFTIRLASFLICIRH